MNEIDDKEEYALLCGYLSVWKQEAERRLAGNKHNHITSTGHTSTCF